MRAIYRWTSEVAAYTDIYFQYIPRDSDLTTAEKLEGWMVSHLADKSVVKKKVRLRSKNAAEKHAHFFRIFAVSLFSVCSMI